MTAPQDGLLLRNPSAVVLTAPGSLRILVPPAELITITGDDAAEARTLIVEATSAPVGPPPAGTRAARMAAALVEHGVLVAAPTASEPSRQLLSGTKVVYGITGAIDAVRARSFLVELREQGCELHVVATKAATRFVNLDGLGWSIGAPVSTDLWDTSETNHVALGNWADIVVVLPASAAFVCRLAAGGYTDLLTATIAATPAPVVVAPSTNTRMWQRTPVQNAIATLSADGFHVVLPGPGREALEPGAGTMFGASGIDPPGLPRLLRYVLGA